MTLYFLWISNAIYRLEPLVSPSSFMLDSPWFEGWGVVFRVASDSYRFGISVPDKDPPGNEVTPRVQKFQLLSHSLQRFALMLTPRSIPGELVSPRILRHAPSCYILVTQRAATVLNVKAVVVFVAWEKRNNYMRKGCWSRTIAFKIVRNFRIQAVRAT